MYKSFSMELAGRTLTVDVGRVAKQANGAAFMHYGDTVVLSTATASDKPRDGIDFFPFDELPGGGPRLEVVVTQKIVFASVGFRPARRAAGRRDRKFELREAFQQTAYDRRFARSRRGGENQYFSGDCLHVS